MAEKTLWGIHAGKTGDADKLFLEKNMIGVGWVKVGESIPLLVEIRPLLLSDRYAA